jgi:hypothetical protein
MGMVMGAFFFGIASLKFAELRKTAHHCIILALIFVPPTIIAGILDWQHYFEGDFSAYFIIKLVLAAVLPILLIAAWRAGASDRPDNKVALILYVLCMLTIVGLGYTGGEIQYG